jgi:hypothetical protein
MTLETGWLRLTDADGRPHYAGLSGEDDNDSVDQLRRLPPQYSGLVVPALALLFLWRQWQPDMTAPSIMKKRWGRLIDAY